MPRVNVRRQRDDARLEWTVDRGQRIAANRRAVLLRHQSACLLVHGGQPWGGYPLYAGAKFGHRTHFSEFTEVRSGTSGTQGTSLRLSQKCAARLDDEVVVSDEAKLDRTRDRQ